MFRPKPPSIREFVVFLFSTYFMIFNVDNVCSIFNSTLINGKGRYPSGPSDVALATVNVCQGKRSVLGLSL